LLTESRLNYGAESEGEEMEEEEGEGFEDVSDALRYEFIKRSSGAIQESALYSCEQALPEVPSTAPQPAEGVSSVGVAADKVLTLHLEHLKFNDVGSTIYRSLAYDFMSYAAPMFHSLRTSVFGISGEAFAEAMGGSGAHPALLPVAIALTFAVTNILSSDSALALFHVSNNISPDFALALRHFSNQHPHTVALMKRSFSTGSSGAFIYFSVCKHYMVKTLTRHEKNFLLKILPQYLQFMRSNRDTKLCHFYGLYSIRIHGHKEYLVCMNNILCPPDDASPTPDDNTTYKIDELYDLKGSSVDRHGDRHPTTLRVKVFKDNDLIEKIRIGPVAAQGLREQLQRDSAFLQSLNIMDYSLLVGVVQCTEPNLDHPEHGGGGPSDKGCTCVSLAWTLTHSTHIETLLNTRTHAGHSDDRFMSSVVVKKRYHIGIIDFLQEWNCGKRAELCTKTVCLFHCSDWKGISAVNPRLYQQRFAGMVEKVLE
jgi:hypothetical protein